MLIPERHCPITVFGPTVPLRKGAWVARIPNNQNRITFPVTLRYRGSSTGRVAYSYRVNYVVQHLARGKEKLLQEIPCLFITDSAGHTRVLRLHTDRWALSEDGTRLAAGYGRYDGGSDFREGLGYIDCRVELWDTTTGKRIASQRLGIDPTRVGFVGDTVRIDSIGTQSIWELPDTMRPITALERQQPVLAPELLEVPFDPTDGTIILPGNGQRIPAILPHPYASVWQEGRLLTIGPKPVPLDKSPSLTPMPVWLDAVGSSPYAATPEEWQALLGISPETLPTPWSPSATCFGVRERENLRIVQRGTGETLHQIEHSYVRSITDDGKLAVLSRDEENYRYSLLHNDGTEYPLLSRGFPRAAFSRAGDCLFVTDDHYRHTSEGLTARCFDTKTGAILWETLLPKINYNWTGGALWSEDDSTILVGILRGTGANSLGGLLALSREGAILYQISLGAFLPYPIPMAGAAGILVHTDGLLLLVRI